MAGFSENALAGLSCKLTGGLRRVLSESVHWAIYVPPDVRQYVARRQASGAAASTINKKSVYCMQHAIMPVANGTGKLQTLRWAVGSKNRRAEYAG